MAKEKEGIVDIAGVGRGDVQIHTHRHTQIQTQIDTQHM